MLPNSPSPAIRLHLWTHPPTHKHVHKPNTTMAVTCSDICKFIAAILLPPLGVFLEVGCETPLLINILLTILGFIPGIIHALYVILKY